MMSVQRPDITTLKQFALTMSWAFPAIIGFGLPWLFAFSWQWWTLAVSVLLLLLYALAAPLIYYPYKFWMGIAGIIGWVNTRIILGAVFYLMILPLGMVLRWLNKLDYQTTTKVASRYKTRTQPLKAEDLEKPF